MKNYGEILKEHRLVRGLTLKDIEYRTNINNGSLSRWERNEVLPSVESCIQLANFYGITIDELLGLEDDFGTRTAAPSSATAGEPLTAEERKVLEQYRNLPEQLRKLIRQQLDVYSSPEELLFKPDKKV